MSFIGFIMFGLIIGAIARLVLPGPQKMGWLATLALGVVGALVGGWISQMTGMASQDDPVSFFMALLGAVIVLVIVQLIRGRRA